MAGGEPPVAHTSARPGTAAGVARKAGSGRVIRLPLMRMPAGFVLAVVLAPLLTAVFGRSQGRCWSASASSCWCAPSPAPANDAAVLGVLIAVAVAAVIPNRYPDPGRKETHMALRIETGVPWVDVEDDFARARRRRMLARLVSWLRREPDDTSLLRFDEVVSMLGFRGEHYLGVRTIWLDTVVGTVDSTRDFDRRFRPASDRDRERWEQLDLAERHGAVMPPIEVYRVGGLHFVKDGHHRVSVAMATGQEMIDADVTRPVSGAPRLQER
jgi:hypothetical protein